MIVFIAKWIIVFFALFFVCVGLLMFFRPEKARMILRTAGSTNFINYAEITIRMIPAAAMIIYADFSKYPEAFKIFGWFMLGTSIVLYFVPRQLHHKFSVSSADILKPLYFQIISPFAVIVGLILIYSVII